MGRPYINVSAFIMEAKTDKVQLEAHNQLPPGPPLSLTAESYEIHGFISRWGANMTANVLGHALPGDGYFLTACYIHTAMSKFGPFVYDDASKQSVTYAGALKLWYENSAMSHVRAVKLEDMCEGIGCGSC